MAIESGRRRQMEVETINTLQKLSQEQIVCDEKQ